MRLRDSHAYHIANLIDQEPEAQVVTLFVAEQLEANIAGLKAENERLKKLIGMCDKDMYSASGKISKKTAIELMKHAGRFQ